MTSSQAASAAQPAQAAARIVPDAAPSPSESAPFFGARFSLCPMSDRFVPIILHAIEGLADHGRR
jgi:hypothetical protein